ncbi:MAG: hypothetical protein CL840_08905 [Crocinitomicaceae bacterium]|nr:hypothetical protein [Crocinitomicaceae bacterium]|tara:strand:- start:37180 stop:38448 length:1269 start_codon:yes stop_codon:yes gene_type:complete
MPEIKVSLILEKRKSVAYYGKKSTPQTQPKQSCHPLAFVFTKLGKRYYYFPGISLTTEDFEKFKSGKARIRWQNEIYKELQALQVRLREIANDLRVFSIKEVKKALGRNPDLKSNLFTYYENHIESIRAEGRIGTYIVYKGGLDSFRNFLGSTFLAYTDLSKELLDKYEKWAIEIRNNSISTVGINMRSLRTIINAAIEDGYLRKEDSPFGRKKYQIPATKNIKKALNLNQIKTIIDYAPNEGSAEEKYRDLWLFIYFGNGMNVTDMCRLKNRDIDDSSITFFRAKTKKSTRTNQVKIIVSLIEPLKLIIEKHRNEDRKASAFLFPFLKENDSEIVIKSKVQGVTKRINNHMKVIASNLGLSVSVTSYTARHSFASTLKKNNHSTTIIKEFLGHKNEATTQAYLDSIEDDQQLEIMKNLIPE